MSIQVLESATAEVFNVEALQRRCLGNQGLVDRVLRKFGIQLTSDLAELEQALAAGDTETIALVSHRLKGMSANVEAGELNRVASAAEQLALSGSLDGLAHCLQRLQEEEERIQTALSQFQL